MWTALLVKPSAQMHFRGFRISLPTLSSSLFLKCHSSPSDLVQEQGLAPKVSAGPTSLVLANSQVRLLLLLVCAYTLSSKSSPPKVPTCTRSLSTQTSSSYSLLTFLCRSRLHDAAITNISKVSVTWNSRS